MNSSYKILKQFVAVVMSLQLTLLTLCNLWVIGALFAKGEMTTVLF